MSMPRNAICEGHCYETKQGQIRRVISIKGTNVTFSARGKTEPNGKFSEKTQISIERFATEAIRECPCEDAAIGIKGWT